MSKTSYRDYYIETKRDHTGVIGYSEGHNIIQGFVVTNGKLTNVMPGATWFQTVASAKRAIDILIDVNCRFGAETPEAAKAFWTANRLQTARIDHVTDLGEAASRLVATLCDDDKNSPEGVALRQVLQQIAKQADQRDRVMDRDHRVTHYVNADGSKVEARVAYPEIVSVYHEPVDVEYEGRNYRVTFQKGCSSFKIEPLDGCAVPDDFHPIAELARPLACC